MLRSLSSVQFEQGFNMPGLRVEFRHLQFLFGITLTIAVLLAQNAPGQASYAAQVRGSVTDPGE